MLSLFTLVNNPVETRAAKEHVMCGKVRLLFRHWRPGRDNGLWLKRAASLIW